MTTYLVVQNKPDSAVAYKFDTRDRAEFGGGMIKDHLVRDGACCYVIENEHDVALSGPRLVDLFNALTESGLKKFESRAIGVERLLRILPTVAVDPPEPKEEVMSEVQEATTEANDAEAPKRRGRESIYAPGRVIHILAEKNPKREGSMAHARFALYRHGMTVEQYLEAGGQLGDLGWDEQRKHIWVS